jgi:hypothetical protein
VTDWWDSLGGWNQFWFIIGVLMVLAALRQGLLNFIRDAGRAWRGEDKESQRLREREARRTRQVQP